MTAAAIPSVVHDFDELQELYEAAQTMSSQDPQRSVRAVRLDGTPPFAFLMSFLRSD
jgi:hypothetical protein